MSQRRLLLIKIQELFNLLKKIKGNETAISDVMNAIIVSNVKLWHYLNYNAKKILSNELTVEELFDDLKNQINDIKKVCCLYNLAKQYFWR